MSDGVIGGHMTSSSSARLCALSLGICVHEPYVRRRASWCVSSVAALATLLVAVAISVLATFIWGRLLYEYRRRGCRQRRGGDRRRHRSARGDGLGHGRTRRRIDDEGDRSDEYRDHHSRKEQTTRAGA